MQLGAAGYAAAGAATAGGVGVGLFGYNRGNYSMDQKLHWSRFTASYAYSMAQTGQYKQDIAELTAISVNRMAVYADIAGMTATILTAIFCPGRVGLHTPPPPGWFMGLMMVNVGGAYIWLAMTMWLAMHAKLKASSATCHMSTRFVRTPVPSQYMLDRARKFLSSWEEQPLQEVLRIPFFRHQSRSKNNEGGFNEHEDMPIDPDAQRRTRHGHDVPAWYRKEKAIDDGEPFESMMPLAAQGTAPEHFEVYREIQNEWWPYDTYARVSIFLAFMHLTFCWVYQHIGHMFCETRAITGAGCIVICVTVLQQMILTLDVSPSAVDIPLQRLGPLAIPVSWFAMLIEYQPYYDPGTAVIGYLLVYVAYAFHIIFTIQLLRICAPDYSSAPEMAEVPAGSWWPNAWRLPKAFQHATFLVAPPRHLQAGENDLVGEMRKASEGGNPNFGGKERLTMDVSEGKRRDVHKALGKQGESPAWFNVRTGLLGLLFAWIYLTFGFTIEIVNAHTSHPSMLNAFGLPNNLRDPRYRPPKVGHAHPTEVGTGGAVHGPAVGMSSHAVERRLDGRSTSDILSDVPRDDLAERLRDILPLLKQVALGKRQIGSHAMPEVVSMLPQVEAMKSSAARVAMQWPALFEPRLLACGHAAAHEEGKVVMALSKHGRGTIISTIASHVGAQEIPAQTQSFSLEGASGYGPLLAAAWDELGLLLAANTGAIIECPGAGPSEGIWSCRESFAARLPLEAQFQGTVALSRHAGKFRAAVTFPGEATVTVYDHSGDDGDSWLPAGEVRTRTDATSTSFSDLAREILLSSADGAVARLHMGTGSMSTAAAPMHGYSDHSWQATCGLHSGGVARLALSQESGVRVPELFLGA
mmetsp:Transcript_34688/g.62977  ORF Transcript_34688/g.62977 Transcript_34688/m.62977 type:complete len:866 (-) Transcript_34688:89-2686(-)